MFVRWRTSSLCMRSDYGVFAVHSSLSLSPPPPSLSLSPLSPPTLCHCQVMRLRTVLRRGRPANVHENYPVRLRVCLPVLDSVSNNAKVHPHQFLFNFGKVDKFVVENPAPARSQPDPFGTSHMTILAGAVETLFHFCCTLCFKWLFVFFLQDLIKKLLVFDPKSRLTAKQALEHPWVKVREDNTNHSTTVKSKRVLWTIKTRASLCF